MDFAIMISVFSDFKALIKKPKIYLDKENLHLKRKLLTCDLASLLKALYDAVGSSIKIPSNGTKSLKLRLTVGQDGSQVTAEKSSRVKDRDNSKNKLSKLKESQKVKEFSKLNNLTQANVQLPAKHNNETQGQSQQQGQSCSKRIQLTSQEQQQLAELVQENMERNHVKQLRRHHSDCRGVVAHDHSHHKRRHRGHCSKNNIESVTINNNLTENNIVESERPKECQDRRNYYLDLAGIENFNSKFASTHTSNPAAGKGQSQDLPNNGHHRSRSHDVNNQNSENIKRESERPCKTENVESGARLDHLRSRSIDPQEQAAIRSPKGQHHKISSSSHRHNSFRPLSLPVHVPERVSPHYHRRHRHRDKDHDLAMQQVAEWIELFMFEKLETIFVIDDKDKYF
ncbi:hypothetical protein KUTeg_019285 [Tegillarca granosa]|uniref:Protein naked cuticle homolog n=1 Tax=Tegillarca granosa TaxID=220873 RepID=A0ABQ9EC33_TEGGR|nr:hypothetical protein KUTeg_019285 [Tegillarca granosa]